MAKREWYDALQSTPDDRVIGAVELVRERCEWPPSIAEFMRLTKELKPVACHKVFPRTLPKPPPNPDIARKAIQDIRAMLSQS